MQTNPFIRKQFSTLLIILFFSVSNSKAQSINQYIKGHFNGSYENYSQYYMKDDKIITSLPSDRIGSNGFLKLDYNYGKFSTGIQLESYLPPILGFFAVPINNQSKIVNKYFKYTENKFSVQVGDFYEQFGNGLIFRAYENRQIGINNALEGINIHLDATDFLKLKVVYGRSRSIENNEIAYANSVSRGIDAEFDINKMIGIKEKEKTAHITLAGSYLGKYEAYVGPIDNFPTTVNAFSGRIDLTSNHFTFNTEYVEKDKDPNKLNFYSSAKGKAIQVNSGYTKNNFGIAFTFRALSNMAFTAERETEFPSIAPLNYLPALTKQQDYLTSSIYVYGTQILNETGIQSDVYYNFKSGTKLGGKYGTKIAANFSLFQSLDSTKNIFTIGKKKYYSDANIEIKKKWSKKLETTFSLQNIFDCLSLQSISEPDVNATIVAMGLLYKFAPQKSVRFKLEHLFVDNDKGNWASALAEFSFSSPYAFFISDLYNYGTTGYHYFNFGTSITKKTTRFSLAFGKQREGLFCAGGVCRTVPASYGFTASLTTSFAN